MADNKINIRKLEADLWESADLLRAGSKLTSSQYCMPVLALLFLRYAYSRFKMVEAELLRNCPSRGGRVMPVEPSDFAAKSALYLPREAQFDYLVNLSDDQPLGEAVNHAMTLVEEQSEHFFVVENTLGENPAEPLAVRMEAEGHLYQSDPSVDKTEKCVLTGYIPKSDSQFESFDEGKGKRFDMKYIPSINLMAVKYFMPMVDGFVDGYYKVNSMSFKTVKEANPDGTEKENMYLHLSLGDFIKLGEERVFFYRVKLTAGQLHSISKIENDYLL